MRLDDLRGNPKNPSLETLETADLIDLCSFETASSSSSDFLRDVSTIVTGGKNLLEHELGRLSRGHIVSLEDPAVQATVRQLEWGLRAADPRGFGIISTSLGFNRDMERFWAAFAAWQALQNGFHPLLIPIDWFQSYLNVNSSLAVKTRHFSSEKPKDDQGRPFLHLVTAISDSAIFQPATLEAIPPNYLLQLDAEEKAALNNVTSKLLKKYQTLDRALAGISAKFPNLEEDLKFILCFDVLVENCSNTWSTVNYENSSGIPLVIIAPKPMHDGMLLLDPYDKSEGSRSGLMSLGGTLNPPFDFDNGRLVTNPLVRPQGANPYAMMIQLQKAQLAKSKLRRALAHLRNLVGF